MNHQSTNQGALSGSNLPSGISQNQSLFNLSNVIAGTGVAGPDAVAQCQQTAGSKQVNMSISNTSSIRPASLNLKAHGGAIGTRYGNTGRSGCPSGALNSSKMFAKYQGQFGSGSSYKGVFQADKVSETNMLVSRSRSKPFGSAMDHLTGVSGNSSAAFTKINANN